MAQEKTYNVLDLFCGCGGLSKGFEQAGYNILIGVDFEQSALNTFEYNHKGAKGLCLDLSKDDSLDNIISAINGKSVDVIIGGPPCQGFSMANRQRVIDDPRNRLYKAYLRILSHFRPQFFVMENVKGMLQRVDEIKEDMLSVLGSDYQFDCRLLNAKDFGVPQNRERLVFIGNRLGIRTSKIFDCITKRKSTSYVLKDALFGLPTLQARPKKNMGDVEDVRYGLTEREFQYPKTDFYCFINGGRNVTKLYNHKNRYNNERDIEIYRRLPQGANSLHKSIKDIMPYGRRKDIFKDKYFKLQEDQVCKTITSHMRFDCNMYIHPWESRGLSPREAARIQTFPDDFVVLGSQNKWYAQIGNAVPVKLAESIARGIKEYKK